MTRFWFLSSVILSMPFTLLSAQAQTHPVPPPPRPADSKPTDSALDLASLQRLADSNDPAAQFELGNRYATGQGVPKDNDQARTWYNKAIYYGDASLAGAAKMKLNQLDQPEIASQRGPAATEITPKTPSQPVSRRAIEGPSLDMTLQFIAEKINEIGTVNYVAFVQNTTDGSTFSNKFSDTFSRASSDSGQCAVRFKLDSTRDGQIIADKVAAIPMREVEDIVVMPLEQSMTQSTAAAGHPELVVNSVSPPITVISVRRLHGGGLNVLNLTDAALADRVAKAITHAVELCGGGEKGEPF